MTIVKVENLPSTVNLDVNKQEHVYIDTSTSAGRIDYYDGAIGGTVHGQDAIRAIILNTPTSVHMDFKDIGEFPGGARRSRRRGSSRCGCSSKMPARAVAGPEDGGRGTLVRHGGAVF